MAKRIRASPCSQIEAAAAEVSTKDSSSSTGLGRQNPRFDYEALFCNTPVAVVQPCKNPADAPKRSTVQVCRSQLPPRHLLHREFSLRKFGFSGATGYVFNYHRGEVNLYQIGDGEKFSVSTPLTPVKYDDWVIVKALIPLKDFLPEEAINPPTQAQMVQKNVLYRACWKSNRSFNGEWKFQVSIYEADQHPPANIFHLDSINPDVGASRSVIALLVLALCSFLNEFEASSQISDLFESCCQWDDCVAIKTMV